MTTMTMLTFFKKHHNVSVFFLYFIIGIIFLLPAVFLIFSNLALDLDKFTEWGRFFEEIKDFQANGLGSFLYHPYQIFDIFVMFFAFHNIFSEPLGFNLFLLILFPLGALGGYRLFQFIINSVNQNSFITIFSGVFFGLFSLYFPIIVFLSFFLLFFFKFLEKQTRKYGILSLLFFLFLMNYSLFLGISVLLLIMVIFVFSAFVKLKLSFKNLSFYKPFLIKTLILFVIFVIFFAWEYYLPLRKIKPIPLNNQLFLKGSFDFSFLIKPFLDFTQNISSTFTASFFVSVLISLVILFLVVYVFRRRSKNVWIGLFIFLSFLFFILSMGPYFKFDGAFCQSKIALPYLFLYYYFPFFNQTTVISGFLLYAMFFLLLIAVMSIVFLFEKFNAKKNALILGPVAIMMVLFFYSSWRPGNIIPEFYKTMAQDKDGFTVALLSPSVDKRGDVLYKNSAHSNPIIFNGNLLFDTFEQQGSIERGNLFSNLTSDLSSAQGIGHINFLNHNYQDSLSGLLKKEGVKYIIFDNKFLDEGDIIKIPLSQGNEYEEKDFQNLFTLRKFIKFFKENSQGNWQVVGDSIVYKVNSVEEGLLLLQGDNWEKDELGNGQWALQNASLILENHSSKSKNVEIWFKARTNGELRKLEIKYTNKKTVFIVGPETKTYLLNLENVKPNSNIINFKILNFDDEAPMEAIEKETKNESILFHTIKYNEVEKTTPPDFYEEIKKKDGDNKILVIPAEIDYLNNSSDFATTYHDIIDEPEERTLPLPLLNELFFNKLDVGSMLGAIDRDYYYLLGQEIINRYKIKYIALYKNLLTQNESSNLIKFILYNVNIKNVIYDQGGVLVLEIEQKNITKQIPFEFIGNWRLNQWEEKLNQFVNVAYDEAKLRLINSDDNNVGVNLKFKVKNFLNEARKLKIFLNEDWLDEKALAEFDILPMRPDDETDFNIEILNLRPQENELLFKVFDENNIELDINKEDEGLRMLGFSIEKKEQLIRHEVTKKINICSEKYQSIFQTLGVKKEFYDDFENREFTKANWDIFENDKPWALKFDTQNKINKQSIKIYNYAQMVKGLDMCADLIEVEMLLKINKWKPDSELYTNFIGDDDNLKIQKSNGKIQRGMVKFIGNGRGVYSNRTGKEFTFPADFSLGEWVHLKIQRYKSGNLILYVNNAKIVEVEKYDGIAPTAFHFMVAGTILGNLDLNIDNFKISYK